MKTNQIKNFLVIVLMCVVCGCFEFEKYEGAYQPYVDITSVDLFVGEDAGDRNMVQLTSTPAGQQFTWSSLVPEVATVDQTGLVTALSEGFTIITVASAKGATEVSVRVQNWVPLQDFTLDKSMLMKPWMTLLQIVATFDPPNTTEPDIVWTSSNPNVASVTENGWVLCTGRGAATIYARTRTASGKEIERSVEIAVDPELERIPTTLWSFPGYVEGSSARTIGYSSQHVGALTPVGSGPITCLLDPDVNLYWQNNQTAPVAIYPHWFIVDLGQTETIYSFMLQRRQSNGNGPSGCYFYTSEDEAPIGSNVDTPRENWNWVFQGDFVYDPTTNNEQNFMLDAPARARYVMVYMDLKHRRIDNCMFASFGLYGLKAEE